MKRLALFLVVVGLAWVSPGNASSGQGQQATEPQASNEQVSWRDGLTIDEAIQLALAQNPDLQALRGEIARAQAQFATASQWPFNPQLEFEYAADNVYENEGVRDWEIGLSQEFELRGQRGWRKRIAQSRQAQVGFGIRQAEWELRSEVSVVFHRVILLNRSVELVQTRLDVAERLLEVAEARRDAMQIPGLEVNLVRLEFHRAQNTKVRLAREARLGNARLAWLIGLAPQDTLQVEGQLETSGLPELHMESLVKRAMGGRGDLAAARAEVEATEQQIGLRKSEIWPGATLGFFYRSEEDPILVNGASDIVRDQLLGVVVSTPIPLLNRRSGEIKQAESEHYIASARLEALTRTARREVLDAVERMHLVAETLTIYENDLNRLSEENLADIERAFGAGEVGAIEVLRAQDDFAEINQGYVEALFEYRRAAAELDVALGPPLEALGQFPGEEEK